MTREEAKRFGHCILAVADADTDKDTIEFTKIVLEVLEQEKYILNTLDFAIDASNGDTNYFVGFRNGLRFSKSLIDREAPQFESCTEQGQKWVPCSERLPEKEYENYLVSTSNGEVDIGTYGVKGWSMCDADGFYYPQHRGIEVVAWMPLPKPYEPQETETWNGIHAQITAPKGTFKRIWNDADKENEE